MLYPVSVVIPTHGSPDLLSVCLRALRRNSFLAQEVLVVETSDSPIPAENLCREEGAILLRSRNSFSAAINEGIRRFSGEYLVWLNDDVLVSPSWDVRMIKAFEEAPAVLKLSRVGFAGPRSNAVGGPQKDSTVVSICDLDSFSETYYRLHGKEYAHSPQFLSGFCLMCSRAAVSAVGMLDESFGEDNFGGFEDNDYILRGESLGFSSVIVGGVLVKHRMSVSFDRFSPQSRRGLENKNRFRIKWPGASLVLEPVIWKH